MSWFEERGASSGVAMIPLWVEPHREAKRGGHGKKSMALPEAPGGWNVGECCCWRMLMCPAVNRTSSACSHSSFKTLLEVPARPEGTVTPQAPTCSSTGSLRGKHPVKGNRIPLVMMELRGATMQRRMQKPRFARNIFHVRRKVIEGGKEQNLLTLKYL